MKKALLALAVAGAAVSAQADVKLSGHVNFKAGDLEDFNTADTTTRINGATNSGSRFRITASKKANDVTYGLKQEFSVNAVSSAKPVGIRVNEFYLKGDFGKVSLGQGSEVGDGYTEKDFSGTYLVNGGGLWVFESGGYSQIDGGRDQRLRYDSPKVGGVATVSIDVDDSDNLGLGANLGGANWGAGVYHESKDANDADETGASFALKAGVITGAVQIASKDATATGAADSADFTKVILGYRSGPISVALAATDSETGNGQAKDRQGTSLGIVYRPTGGVELYGGLLSDKDKNANTTDSGFLVGGRVRF